MGREIKKALVIVNHSKGTSLQLAEQICTYLAGIGIDGVTAGYGSTAEDIDLAGTDVAISLGGTMGAGETTRVVRLLEEKGLLEDLKKGD